MAEIKNLNNTSVRFENGNNLVPSIAFIGDPNTGIFQSAADTLQIAVGGNQKVRVDTNGVGVSAGNVYISSDFKLNFDYGTSNNYFLRKLSTTMYMHSPVNLSLQTDGNHRLYINQVGNVGIGTTSPAGLLHIYNNGAVGGNTGIILENSTFNTQYGIYAGINGVTSGGFSIFDKTNLVNRFVIAETTGNVGIGTASPGSKLHVVGASDIVSYSNGTTTGYLLSDANGIGLFNGANGSGTGIYARTANVLDFYYGSSIGMRLSSTGNVGIGTTSPNAKLQVGGNLNIFDEEGNTDASLFVSQGSTNTTTVVIASNGNSYFNGGNVGIGTTSPTHPLHVEGYIATNSSSNVSGLLVRKAGSTIGFVGQSGGWVGNTTDDLAFSGETGKNIRFYTNGSITERMRITDSGNVGIGTTSPVDKLHVEGVIQSKKELLPSTSGTAGWYKIGTMSGFTQGGATAVLEFAGHQGYNAINSQDYLIKLFLKTSNGNGGGPDGQGYNSWYERTGGNNATIEFKWDNSATNDYDLYMYIPIHSLRSWYSVKKGTGTWEHVGTSATDPGANSSTVLKATGLFNILDANVGIGTSSPGKKLDVNGEARVNSILTLNRASAASLKFSRGSDFYLGIDDSGNLNFLNNVASSLGVWQNTGNLGIGTTSPTAKLEIASFSTGAGLKIKYGNSVGTIEAVNFIANGGANGVIGMQMVSAGVGDLWLGGSGGRSLTLYRDGNVGIGKTDPSAPLHINGGSTNQVVKIQSTTAPYVRFKEGGTDVGFIQFGTDSYISNQKAGTLNFRTNNTDKMTILSGGNVGIGTTSPSYKLHVDGDIGVNGNDAFKARYDTSENYHGSFRWAGLQLGNNGANKIIAGRTAAGGYFQFYVNNTNDASDYNVTPDGTKILTLAADGTSTFTAGNVGIGITDPQADLHIGANSPLLTLGVINTSTGNAKLQFFSKNDGTANGYAIQYTKGTGVDRLDFIDGSGNPNIVFKNGGNVGIGTTSPLGIIDIRGDYGRWRVNGYGGMYFRNDSSGAYENYIHPRSDGSLSIGRVAVADLDSTAPNTFAQSTYDDITISSIGDVTFHNGINFDGVNGANFVVNTDGQRIVWEYQRNGTRKMTFYHEADADTFNFNFESGNKLQINGNRIVTVNELGTAAASDTGDFATAAQGTKADSALQPADIITFAGDGVGLVPDGTSADASKFLNGDAGWTVPTNTVTSVGVSGDLSTGNITLAGSGDVTVSKSGGTITIDCSDTDTQYTAGAGLDLTGTSFSVEADLSSDVHTIGRDANDKYVVNTSNHAWYLDGVLDMRLANNGTLDVDGDVVAFSTVTNSDRRLKTDIETIENASEKVSKLRGVSYTWDHGKRKGQRDIGLIAQEVEEVVPEVVSEGELLDGTTAKRVDYAKLVGLLIESNKELQAQVNELKDRLDGITK